MFFAMAATHEERDEVALLARELIADRGFLERMENEFLNKEKRLTTLGAEGRALEAAETRSRTLPGQLPLRQGTSLPYLQAQHMRSR